MTRTLAARATEDITARNKKAIKIFILMSTYYLSPAADPVQRSGLAFLQTA
jgi:hypothetical protein